LKKLFMYAPVSMVIFSLMGCNFNQNDKAANDGNNKAQNVVYENENEAGDHKATNHSDPDHNDQTQFEAADEAADRVAELDEVDSANVIVANQTAYVAVVLRDTTNEEVTEGVENKIAEQVKSSDPAIQKVYVSTNPDFVDQIKDYRKRINEGEPVEGLFDEFTDVVQRVFPDAH
jgi:YhcN/YlaJ family sporulation lipoprotein